MSFACGLFVRIKEHCFFLELRTFLFGFFPGCFGKTKKKLLKTLKKRNKTLRPKLRPRFKQSLGTFIKAFLRSSQYDT